MRSPVKTGQRKARDFERLVYLPVIAAVLVMWISLATYTVFERKGLLERAQSQLAATVATLADFNELAQNSNGGSGQRNQTSRSNAIWRALLQYPTANIWVDTAGVVSAGTPPTGDLSRYILVEDARADFTVHAALPRADALGAWRRTSWWRGGVLAIVSLGFLLLARMLSAALRQRAVAEREVAAAEERAAQLTLYRNQLEHTVAERTTELKSANSQLEKELTDRKAAEKALREHDALLNVVTQSAALLLGTQHEDAIAQVLGLVGQTLAVGRVQLCQITPDSQAHLRSRIRYEWCAPGLASMIDHPKLQNLDLTAALPRSVTPRMLSGGASYFIDDLTGTHVGIFELAKMRSFLQIPVMMESDLWGSLNFIDSASEQREWSWAESDTLKTLAGLIGVALTRAQYVKELADANMIVQNSPTILYRLRGEPSFPLIYISHNITKFGHDPQELVRADDWANFLIDPGDRAKVAEAMARVLERDAEAASFEFRMRTGDGGFRWVENRYTPVRDRKDGRLVEVEGIIIDITERKAAEEKIAQLARTDALTGLANRATFIERLRQAFAAGRRGAGPFAVLYIDLDHFKDVNDTLGHPVGDALLREVAERLRNATRETDVIARLGGDEFAILQTELADPAQASTLAAKLNRLLAQPYAIAANQINAVTASIGICPYTSNSVGPDAMLAQADLALYRSKAEGRNQYHFHSDELDHEVLARVEMAEELRRALERDEMALFYQPQVDVRSGAIVGIEALLRWNHPKRGLLSAEAFIATAEKAGLTMALGGWVLDHACGQMRIWRDAGIAPTVMAINLSLSQLKNARDLIRTVTDATAKWRIPPADLEFDVTEAILAQTTFMQNDVLAQLRALGARIAIDDFGTQYSSFEYLRTYRVSHLKIARSYIQDAPRDAESAATVRAIMNIARELDIGVIAEGVETAEQCRMLASAGLPMHAQGYYFSAAVSATDAEVLLRRGALTAPVEGVECVDAETLLATMDREAG
jgi:diguanylate cyclase (GGDEF)-like protein/PAS domain S-box-containing protein